MKEQVLDFLSQPFGVAGAFFIMLAVTIFNGRSLQKMITSRFDHNTMNFTLNFFNLIGGILLFINAVLRNEVVWKVMELYFVIISLKGLTQNVSEMRSNK